MPNIALSPELAAYFQKELQKLLKALKKPQVL